MTAFGDSVAALRAAVSGAVLEPGDAGYDDARSAWNLNLEHRPRVAVRPASDADVAAAVRFARANALPIAVQSTGHGAVLPCDGLLIDTSAMQTILIDEATQVATVGPGVVWGDFNRKAFRHGLVGLSGYVPGVGILGFTLGGGIGWLSRAHGYAADSVVEASVVLADGSIVRASEREHPDLFWALRGGGGNFGIVTSLSFRCYRRTAVYGGTLTYPLAEARRALRTFATWTETAPEALSSSLTLMTMPPDDALPEALRGQTVVNLGVCFAGSPADGESFMHPWRERRPIAGELAEVATSDLGAIEAGPPGGLRVHSRCVEFANLSEPVLDIVAAAFEQKSLLRMIEIRATGGAMARSSRASAVTDGDARYIAQIQSTLEDPATRETSRAQASGLANKLLPYATGTVSLSFLPDGEEGVAEVPSAFDAETFARLRAVKARYDPDNALRLNYNIAPSGR